MSKIIDLIKKWETNNNIQFSPTKKFYLKIDIRQRRWGQIVRNEKDPTVGELRRISKFFGVNITDLIEEVEV